MLDDEPPNTEASRQSANAKLGLQGSITIHVGRGTLQTVADDCGRKWGMDCIQLTVSRRRR
jgi:hypothetical protein